MFSSYFFWLSPTWRLCRVCPRFRILCLSYSITFHRPGSCPSSLCGNNWLSITIQIAHHWGCSVYVSSLKAKHRTLARELGATWVGGPGESPPDTLHGAIIFAPAGELVPPALEALDKGGTVALAGIYMTDIPSLNYSRHLFQEHTLQSVTANTKQDGLDLLQEASNIPIRTTTQCFPLEDANLALQQLKAGTINGAAVLTVS